MEQITLPAGVTVTSSGPLASRAESLRAAMIAGGSFTSEEIEEAVAAAMVFVPKELDADTVTAPSAAKSRKVRFAKSSKSPKAGIAKERMIPGYVRIACENWEELNAERMNCPLLGQEAMNALAADFALDNIGAN